MDGSRFDRPQDRPEELDPSNARWCNRSSQTLPKTQKSLRHPHIKKKQEKKWRWKPSANIAKTKPSVNPAKLENWLRASTARTKGVKRWSVSLTLWVPSGQTCFSLLRSASSPLRSFCSMTTLFLGSAPDERYIACVQQLSCQAVGLQISDSIRLHKKEPGTTICYGKPPHFRRLL